MTMTFNSDHEDTPGMVLVEKRQAEGGGSSFGPELASLNGRSDFHIKRRQHHDNPPKQNKSFQL
jgi:hypothetical protein